MKSREKKQCHLCTRWLAKQSNLVRHLKNVHGIDIEARRQILLTDGEYRCSLHNRPIRFFRRQGLKQHLYYVHRRDDQEVLARHGYNKALINTPCKLVRGHLYEFKCNKDHMMYLYDRNNITYREILDMETLNDTYEQELRDRQYPSNFKLMEDYRKTMQPVIDEDEDDLYTKVRLRLAIRLRRH